MIRSGLKKNATILIPAFLIALFVLIGFSIDYKGSVAGILSSPISTVGMLAIFIMSFLITFLLLKKAFEILDKMALAVPKDIFGKFTIIKKARFVYEKHPYLSVYLLFLILQIPYIIATYPAMFWGDSPSQIMQGFNIKDETASYLNLIDKNFYLNQHHPVVHTILIHICLLIGTTVFHSYNLGIFIYAFLQFSFVAMTIAHVTRYMYSHDVPGVYILVMLSFVSLSPRLQNHLFLVSKDIPYGCFTLLFLISLFELIDNYPLKYSAVIWTFLFGLGVFLFRNEGKIVGSIVLLFAAISSRRKIRGGAHLFWFYFVR